MHPTVSIRNGIWQLMSFQFAWQLNFSCRFFLLKSITKTVWNCHENQSKDIHTHTRIAAIENVHLDIWAMFRRVENRAIILYSVFQSISSSEFLCTIRTHISTVNEKCWQKGSNLLLSLTVWFRSFTCVWNTMSSRSACPYKVQRYHINSRCIA